MPRLRRRRWPEPQFASESDSWRYGAVGSFPPPARREMRWKAPTTAVVIRRRCRSGVFGWQAGLHPGLYATAKRLDVGEPLTDVSGCLPGSCCLGRSGAIKDDLLVLRQALRHRRESCEWDRPFEATLAALRIVFVAAHQ